MKFVKAFESFESLDEIPKKREARPRPDRKDIKRCVGRCERKLFMKDGKPILHCPSCDRFFELEK